MSETIFTISRSFAAPRAALWQAWTTGEGMAQWLGPPGAQVKLLECDVRPGRRTLSSFVAPGAPPLYGRFTYREVIIPLRLVWLHAFADETGNVARHPFSETWPLEMLTTVTFDDVTPGKTGVTLTWQPHNARPDEVQTFAEGMDSMQSGWAGSFDQLDRYLSKAAA